MQKMCNKIPGKTFGQNFKVVNFVHLFTYEDYGLYVVILCSEFRLFSKQIFIETIQTKELSVLTEAILTNNYFHFSTDNYVNVSGTAMGTLIMTPNYTSLFIHLLEQQHFIYNSPTHSKKRKNKVEFHRWLLYH